MNAFSIFQDNDRPVVWVVGRNDFLTIRLSSLISSMHAQIIVIGEEVKKKELLTFPKPHYIFDIGGFFQSRTQETTLTSFAASELTKELLEIAKKVKAKFLLVSMQGEQLAGGDNFNSGENSLRDFSIKKAHAQFSKSSEALVSSFAGKVDARIVRVGDVYGPGMLLANDDPLSDILRSKLYREEPKEIEGEILPLFIDDAVRGILTAMFGGNSRDKIFYFDVQKIAFPDIVKIVSGDFFLSPFSFSENSKAGNFTNVLAAPTPLKEGLGKTIDFFESQKISFAKKNHSSKKSGKKKFQPRVIFGRKFLWLGCILIFLASPFFIFAVAAGAGEFGKKQFLEGNFDRSGKLFNVSESLFTLSRKIFAKLSYLPLIENKATYFMDLSHTGVVSSQAASQGVKVAVLGQKIVGNIFFPELPESEKVATETFAEFSRELELFANRFELSKAQAKFNLDIPPLSSLSNLARQLPNILGFNGQKTYLVLFQNSTELRPTGGFIGSLGLFSFEKGKLVNTEIFDVYEADGQLHGHVEPPPKLKEHLGEASWYLRDSNWSPDFPTSAQRAGWFLDKELGGKVDGVVAVDLEFAKDLISVLGEIEVLDFNERVNNSNFYQVVQSRVERNFFPGSTQKADFLTALTRSLIDSFNQQARGAVVPLSKVFLSSLEEKHTQIYLNDNDAQREILDLGWDGGLKNSKCKMQPFGFAQGENAKCVEDYLFIVEANVGVNKANYNINRSYVLDIFPRKENITHELVISYSNKAKDANLKYKNYLRVYLPQGSVLIKSELVNQKTGAKLALQADKDEEKGKDVFGMLVEIGPGESQQLFLTWQVLPTGELGENSELAFLWQKQGGTARDPLFVRFHWPKGANFSMKPSFNLTNEGILSYNTKFTHDLSIRGLWTNQP